MSGSCKTADADATHPPLTNAAPLDQRSRAEMVAALRMVDYVVAPSHDQVENLIHSLKPAAVVRLEAAHARLAAQLVEHVHRRQNR